MADEQMRKSKIEGRTFDGVKMADMATERENVRGHKKALQKIKKEMQGELSEARILELTLRTAWHKTYMCISKTQLQKKRGTNKAEREKCMSKFKYKKHHKAFEKVRDQAHKERLKRLKSRTFAGVRMAENDKKLNNKKAHAKKQMAEAIARGKKADSPKSKAMAIKDAKFWKGRLKELGSGKAKSMKTEWSKHKKVVDKAVEKAPAKTEKKASRSVSLTPAEVKSLLGAQYGKAVKVMARAATKDAGKMKLEGPFEVTSGDLDIGRGLLTILGEAPAEDGDHVFTVEASGHIRLHGFKALYMSMQG